MDPGLLLGEKIGSFLNLKSSALPPPGKELGCKSKSKSKEGDGHEQGKAHKLGHSSQPGARSLSVENLLKYIDQLDPRSFAQFARRWSSRTPIKIKKGHDVSYLNMETFCQKEPLTLPSEGLRGRSQERSRSRAGLPTTQLRHRHPPSDFRR